MRIPFRRQPAPTAPPGLGPSRHAEIASFRAPPDAEAGQALINERRYAEACELYAKQASAARQLIELGEQNNIPPALSMRPEFDMRMAWALDHVSLMKLELGQIGEAVKGNAESLLVYRRLTADDLWFGQFLAMCLLARAIIVLRLPDVREATSALEEAIAIQRAVTRQVHDNIWQGFHAGFADLAEFTRNKIAEAASEPGTKNGERARLKDVGPGLKEATFASPADAIKILRGYVMPPGKLTAGAAENAPEILPGLVLAVATWQDEELGFLPYSSMVQAFGDPALVRRAAVGNLQNLDGIDVVKMVFSDNEETETMSLVANDPFVASRVAVLPWLVERVYGEPARHGTLLILPIRGVLQFHVIRNEAALQTAKVLAVCGHELLEQAPEEARIVPDVFMVGPDGRTERVAHLDEHGNEVVDAGGLLGEALYGPPPHGLNLPR
jgi:hypothetical protein